MNQEQYTTIINNIETAINFINSKNLRVSCNYEDITDVVEPENEHIVSYIKEDCNLVEWDNSSDIPMSYFLKIWGPNYTQEEYEKIIMTDEYLKLEQLCMNLWDKAYNVILYFNIEAEIEYQADRETEDFLNHWVV